MWKLFLTTFLSEFVNEVLTAKKGVPIFKGKGVVSSTGPQGTTLDLNLGASSKYQVIVKRVN